MGQAIGLPRALRFVLDTAGSQVKLGESSNRRSSIMAKKVSQSPPLLPQARPLVLCLDVLGDPTTGNVHVLGIFDAIRPQGNSPYPHRHPEFCVFIQLTDAHGTLPGKISILEPSSGDF